MTKPTKPERNAGAIALACTGLSQQLIARRLGMKDRSAIANWKSGKFKPRPAMRERMHVEFGIAPQLWDLGAIPKAKAKKPRTGLAILDELRAPKRSTPAALLDMIDRALELYDEETASVDLPFIERATTLLMVTRALQQLHRLTGERAEPSIRTIMNSSHWQPLERAMRSALSERWPDALAAVEAGIAQLYADDTESIIWNHPVREFGADHDAPPTRPAPAILPRSRPLPNTRRSRRGRSRAETN